MGRMGKKIIDSTLVKLGSDPQTHHGSLSDPIYKTSTIIIKNFLMLKKISLVSLIMVGLVIIPPKDSKKLYVKSMEVSLQL